MCFFYSLLVAPSVTGITATPYTDVPSNRYDYTIICTIHPESTADTCEVMVRSGAMSITSMYSLSLYYIAAKDFYTCIASCLICCSLHIP